MIAQLLFGLVAGYTARFFLPGHDRWGVIVTTLIGIAGAWAGPQLAAKAGLGAATGVKGFLYAVGGSMLLLIVLRML